MKPFPPAAILADLVCDNSKGDVMPDLQVLKLCNCGRLATHYIQMFTINGEPTTKQLACDQFPNCRPIRRR